jgi:hypothetical protein
MAQNCCGFVLTMASSRECHGLGNPRGLQVRVITGTGAGGKFPTHNQPSPAVRVTQTRCRFFSVKVLKSSAAESGLFVNSQCCASFVDHSKSRSLHLHPFPRVVSSRCYTVAIPHPCHVAHAAKQNSLAIISTKACLLSTGTSCALACPDLFIDC